MYQIERWERRVNDAPHITDADLISLTDAAAYLDITTQAIDYYVRTGQISFVTKAGEVTSHGRPRRWLLRVEVEQLKEQRHD